MTIPVTLPGITTIESVIRHQRNKITDLTQQHNDSVNELAQLRDQPAPDRQRIEEVRASISRSRLDLDEARAGLADAERVQADEARLTAAAEVRIPHANAPEGGLWSSAAGFTHDRQRTYNERNKDEFLRDLFGFSMGSLRGEAIGRLERHEAEARAAGQLSERAMTSTGFAGIIPPQYLIDQYALIARAGRPTANVTQHFDLPSEGMSLVIPRGTTGVTTGVQASENSALATQDEVWTNVTVPVVTAGGYNDVSRQSIERASGTDMIIFGDLMAAYAVNVDQQVLSGTGASGQALGILNTSGISQASAFTAAATIATFYTKLAGAINAVETTRMFAPNVILMHPRRWNWLLTQLDSSNRPLLVPNGNGPMNAVGVANAPVDTASITPVGTLFGLNVVTDPNIPTAAGSGPEDQIIVARREDLMLWEDPNAPFTLRFEQPVGQNLTVRLVAYGYFAFTAGRFPSAVGVIGGNSGAGFGLVPPTF